MTARSIWIVGATSAIAHAYARRRVGEGVRFVLLGRNAEHLSANAADLTARGGEAAIETLDLAGDLDRDAVVTGLIERHGLPDEVLIAYGILGDQPRALTDLKHARDIIEFNFTSVALWVLAICARRNPQRALTLIVVGSVAGDRGRGSNFVYGAAKGGLDRFLEGLQHAFAGTPLHVVRVKPGFVDTPMTAEIKKGGPLWATPDRVAGDIVKAVNRRRTVVYTPWFWRLVMAIVRAMPAVIFNRVKI